MFATGDGAFVFITIQMYFITNKFVTDNMKFGLCDLCFDLITNALYS